MIDATGTYTHIESRYRIIFSKKLFLLTFRAPTVRYVNILCSFMLDKFQSRRKFCAREREDFYRRTRKSDLQVEIPLKLVFALGYR